MESVDRAILFIVIVFVACATPLRVPTTHFDKKPPIFFKAINCRLQASLIRRLISCAAIDATKASGKNQRRSALIGPDKGRQHREGRRNLGDFYACGVGRR
jgi:hypothetical protein